jgi:osmotically-inducible protein OsmY
VSAHKGVGTLSGSVGEGAERAAAKAIARHVPGVTAGVSDELTAFSCVGRVPQRGI